MKKASGNRMAGKRRTRKKIGLSDYARRRKELIALMEPNSIAILPSASLKRRNGDVDYRFRQDSDFHYLSGFDEPGAVFVLIPGREYGESILFCRERDPDTTNSVVTTEYLIGMFDGR